MMWVELCFIAFFVLFALLVWEILVRLSEPKNLPPGPRLSPIFLLRHHKTAPFKLLADIGSKYNGIFTIKSGSEITVVIDDVDIAREALLRKGHDFSGRPDMEITRLIVEGKSIILGDYGPAWKLQRKIAHSALRVYGSARGAVEEKITEEIQHLMERFEKTKEMPVDLQNDVTLAFLNVICAAVFGSRYDLDDPEFQALAELNAKFSRVILNGQKLQIIPWLKYLPVGLMNEVHECTTLRDRFCVKQIKKHRETFDGENIRDLTDALIKVMKDAEDEGSEVKKLLSDKHMILTLMDVFLAGLDTTATTLRWAILYFVTYPEVQTRLQRELDDVLERDHFPSLQDRTSLPFVRAAITETLRLATITPFLTPHKTTVDTKLRGYDIPKDMTVTINAWALHHNPQTWENPFEFNPSRFINSDGEFVYPENRSFLPFGCGPRVCLGESLAKTELFLFLARLLQQFTFKCPPESPPPNLEPQLGVVSYPMPFKVCICKRERRLVKL